mgnify:CR=1 FL=1
MSKDIKNEILPVVQDEFLESQEIDNVTNIDEGRIKRLKERGHYVTMLEQFDVLRVKFIYDQLDKEEATRFITLCKYLKENGHSESLKLTCHYIYQKYMKNQGL